MTAEDCWLAVCFLRRQNSNSQLTGRVHFKASPTTADSYEAWQIAQYFEVSCFQRRRTAFGRRRDSNQHMG